MEPISLREFIIKWFSLVGYPNMNLEDMKEFLEDIEVIFGGKYKKIIKEEMNKVLQTINKTL